MDGFIERYHEVESICSQLRGHVSHHALMKKVVLAALSSGRRVFLDFLERGDLVRSASDAQATESSSSETKEQPLEVFRKWVAQRFDDDFFEITLNLIGDDSTDVATTAILTALDFITHPRARILRGKCYEQGLMFLFVRRLTEVRLDDNLGAVLRSEVFGALGIRSLRALGKVASLSLNNAASASASTPKNARFGDQAENLVRLLSFVTIPSSASELSVDSDDESQGDAEEDSDGGSSSGEDGEEGGLGHKNKKRKAEPQQTKKKKASANSGGGGRLLLCFKRAFENAWLALLKLPMRPQTYKQVLLQLPEQVMPHLLTPLKLSDFLTESYELGGLSSILALSSLWILMRLHGLDYPEFYDSLYKSLTPSVFHAKHRARFFRLLNLCLSSASLPTYVVAAFLKRLNRLALGAPPASALFVLALTKNLLVKHSECRVLITNAHSRKGGGGGGGTAATAASSSFSVCTDEFDLASSSALMSNALQSSLWELQAMKAHYHPAVSTLCGDIERIWEKHEAKIPMEDYLAHTYKELFQLESQAKMKATPLNHRAPTGLLGDGDFLSGVFSAV